MAAVAHVAGCLVKLLGLRPESTFAVSSVIDQRERVAALSETFARNAASVIGTEAIPASATRGEIAGVIHRRLEPILAKPSLELEAVASLTAEVAHYGLPYTTIPIADVFGRRQPQPPTGCGTART